MKLYKRYIDSEVEWIGEMPEHWESKKLKFIAEIILGKMLTPKDPGGYFEKPYLRAKNLTWLTVNVEDINTMWFSERELDTYRLEQNDLLVSEGGEVGRTCIWQDELEECYIQNSVNRVRLHDQNNPRYFLYQFYAAGKKGHFDAVVNRISIAHLTKEKLARVSFVVPPLEEQQHIASYLDRRTTQIDDLISKKRRMIALLKEERAAVINRAVTKGLDPAVEMKESGVEWIGEVPEHWEVMRAKYLCSAIVDCKNRTPPDVPNTAYFVVRTSNVRYGKLDTENLYTTDLESFNIWTQRGEPEKGDVLFTREAPAGEACVFEGDINLCLGQRMMYFRPLKGKLDSHFLRYTIYSSIVERYIQSGSRGSTVGHLRVEQVHNLPVLEAPLNEQKEIVSHLDEKTSQIDTTISKAERQIKLLQEYRTALVSEVVTGKVDVRGEGATG